MNYRTGADDPVLVAPDRCTRYRAWAVPSAVSAGWRPRHLLGVWAHPDDEAYLSAGLMARTIEQGGRVTVVALTDGEAGFPADDSRPAPERARQRRRELRAAMARIGVDDVRFVGLPDGGLAERVDESLVDAVRDLVCQIRPDITVTFGPDGITGHGDHVANWRVVTRAWLDTGIGDLWYAAASQAWLDEWRHVHDEFDVWMTGEPDGIGPDEVVLSLEITGRELARKRAVLGEHGSQTDVIAAALGENAYLGWIRRETFRLPTTGDLCAAVATPGVPAGAVSS